SELFFPKPLDFSPFLLEISSSSPIIMLVDFWDGPKTVFFWAPVMKWGLVGAGLADMARPAEKLSTAQSAVLTATGLIWSRYSLVIIPKNWSLFAVNFFVGCAGGSQLYRIWRYNQELKAQEQLQ
uniref:Mitochondrial pyruvate carrier n=1 Tax=Zosterops lateralis melanops TaxID=1220523 RepID=A0A8D2NWN1_ZOSLA